MAEIISNSARLLKINKISNTCMYFDNNIKPINGKYYICLVNHDPSPYPTMMYRNRDKWVSNEYSKAAKKINDVLSWYGPLELKM